MNTITSNVSKNLKTLLSLKGLTQVEFAKKIGSNQKSVSNWVLGSAGMPLGMIVKTCEVFNISLDDFIKKELRPETRFSA